MFTLTTQKMNTSEFNGPELVELDCTTMQALEGGILVELFAIAGGIAAGVAIAEGLYNAGHWLGSPL